MRDKLTPGEAIRAYCTQCQGTKQFNADQTGNCEGDHIGCSFFPYRLGKRLPVKVFRSFCINCMGGFRDGVLDCPAPKCPVHAYRMGTNPSLTGQVRGSSLAKKLAKDGTGHGFHGQKPMFTHHGVLWEGLR